MIDYCPRHDRQGMRELRLDVEQRSPVPSSQLSPFPTYQAADRLGVPFATIGRYAQALAAWIAARIAERTPEEQAACMAACHGWVPGHRSLV